MNVNMLQPVTFLNTKVVKVTNKRVFSFTNLHAGKFNNDELVVLFNSDDTNFRINFNQDNKFTYFGFGLQ